MKKAACRKSLTRLLTAALLLALAVGAYRSPALAAGENYVGNYVTLGRYVQSESPYRTSSDPIEWLVLDQTNGVVTLISRKGLEWKQYHEGGGRITWKDCSLRVWLNTDFLDTAFTAAEKTLLLGTAIRGSTVDVVSILSQSELEGYRNAGIDLYSRQGCEVSVHATRIAGTSGVARDNGRGCWWVRTDAEAFKVGFVGQHGKIYPTGNYTTSFNLVRPVIRIREETLTALMTGWVIAQGGADAATNLAGPYVPLMDEPYVRGYLQFTKDALFLRSGPNHSYEDLLTYDIHAGEPVAVFRRTMVGSTAWYYLEAGNNGNPIQGWTSESFVYIPQEEWPAVLRLPGDWDMENAVHGSMISRTVGQTGPGDAYRKHPGAAFIWANTEVEILDERGDWYLIDYRTYADGHQVHRRDWVRRDLVAQ